MYIGRFKVENFFLRTMSNILSINMQCIAAREPKPIFVVGEFNLNLYDYDEKLSRIPGGK